jgi:hypothetical protein
VKKAYRGTPGHTPWARESNYKGYDTRYVCSCNKWCFYLREDIDRIFEIKRMLSSYEKHIEPFIVPMMASINGGFVKSNIQQGKW